jgi:Na+-transporting NADH:ubiquinone oxidoreductase subunit NqrB
MLLRSTYPAVFVLAGLLAIGSKHFLTVDGHHRFNPSNFGLVVTLAFTQGGIGMVTPGQWGQSGLIVFAIVGVGSLVVFRAQRLTLAGLYLASAIVSSTLLHGGHPELAQTLSGDVLAFAFFMITDPKTAPRTLRGQAIYAPAIAFLGVLFMSFGSMAGIFIAPFVVALVKPLAIACRRGFTARIATPVIGGGS